MRRCLVAVFAIAAILIIMPAETAAQTDGQAAAPAEMQYGLKGGIDFSTLRGDFSNPMLAGTSFEQRAAFTIGGFVAWRFNEIVAFQPEFLWVRKSSKAEASLPEIAGSQIIAPKLDYIEIPLLIRLNPPTEGSIDPIIYAGPNLGFNVRAELLTVVGDESESDDIGNQIEGFDLGLVVGGGIIFGESQLRYRSVRYMLEARLTTGYSDILVDEEAGESAGEFSNSTFAILVGIVY